MLHLTAQKPAFFKEYPADFDPNNQHPRGSYGYTRADNDVILSYDAMLAILNASANILGSNQKVMPATLQQALSKINGSQSFQGVSGQIAFGSNGDPVDKAILILVVSQGGFIQMQSTIPSGTFLKQ